jgi:hypothetical protein
VFENEVTTELWRQPTVVIRQNCRRISKLAFMQPLELNSPHWALLEDAYGAAEQIPQLLAELEGANEDALSELFGRICHQMSVYSSSIAAFPHLIAIASKLQMHPSLQAETLCLAGAICESQEFEQEHQRSRFAGAVEAALPIATDLAQASLRASTDQNQAIYLLKSIAAFGQMQALARVLEGFSNEEFTLECPACSADLYVWPCTEGLFVAAEDPVSNKQTERTFVSAIPSQPNEQAEFIWVEQQGLGTASLSEVRKKLPFLFGQAVCPKCSQKFPLFKELVAQAA